MRRFTIAALAAVVLSGCTTVAQETRVSADIQASEYNSIAARYMARPTLVHVERRSDGVEALRLSFTTYRNQPAVIGFAKDGAQAHAAMLRKYAEWEAQARSRGDAFTKEIGRAPTRAYGSASAAIRYTFHSGNASQHYVALAFCAVGTCLEDTAAYLDAQSAARLAALLDRFAAGQIEPKDVGAAYR